LIAKELSIPLALTLESLGEHVYSLNSISDRLGNNVELRSVNTRSKSDLQRTISVLRPAEFSFQGCRSGQAVKLLQGQETKLHIHAGHHDSREGPWKLSVRYTPTISDLHKGANGKNTPIHGWTKNFMTMERHYSFPVEGPGDYTLTSAQGQICAGDVLSPETCNVVEVPLPRAEIEWKKLHEW
jgi:nucleoporin POM152